MFEILHNTILNYPERIMMKTYDEEISYGEFGNFIASLSNYINKNYSKGPAFVYGHKSFYMPVCFFASLICKMPYIPVDSSTPSDRVNQIIKEINPALILITDDSEINFKNTISLKELKNICSNGEYKSELMDIGYNRNDIFYIMFTSGTTGKPKGIPISYKNLDSFISFMNNINFSDTRSILNQANFSFDLSVADLLYGILSGKTIYCISKSIQINFHLLFEFIKNSDVDMIVATPSFIEYCLIDKSFSKSLLPNLKHIYFCGETLTTKTARLLMDRFPDVRIINAYGPTETTVSQTYVVVEKSEMKYDTIPIAKKHNNTNFYIENDEIIIFGDSVSDGYINNSSDNFLKKGDINFFKTGDIVEIRGEYVYYVERKDNQIKRYGNRIELLDIEKNLLDIENIISSHVISVKNKNGKSVIIAFIVLSSILKESEIKSRLNEKLPKYMIPDKIIIKDFFPLTKNGKLDNKELIKEGETIVNG